MALKITRSVIERISRGDTFQSAGAATRMICLPVYKESL